MKLGHALLREAFAAARSNPVASSLTMFVVAAMVFAVFLTTGRTVGTEQRVLASIGSAESRAILVRADPEAGITTEVLTRLEDTDGIAWAGVFSTATDATNRVNPEGLRVPVRQLYSADLDAFGLPTWSNSGDLVFASASALEQFGLPDVTGTIVLTDGVVLGIGGRLSTPDYLTAFEPLAVVPFDSPAEPEAVAVLVVVASDAARVPAIAEFTMSVLGASDSSKVRIETSTNLTEVKGLVEGQLGTFSRGLVLGLLGLNALAVALILFGLVQMRRKDFGRRRALGASRRLIVELVLAQTGMIATVGVVVGTAAATIMLLASGDPLPDASFIVALGVVGWLTTVLSAAAPAVIASRREPIRELRVP